MLDKKILSNDHDSKITEDSVPEEKRTSASSNDKSTKELNAVKEPSTKGIPEKVEPGDLNKSSNQELPKENQPNIVEERNHLSSKNAPSSVKEAGEGNSVGEPSVSVQIAKDVELSFDSLPLERSEAGLLSNSNVESQPSKARKDVDMVSNSLPSESIEPEQPVASSSKAEPSQIAETPKDVDMMSNSLPLESNEPQQTHSIIENGTTAGLFLPFFFSPL